MVVVDFTDQEPVVVKNILKTCVKLRFLTKVQTLLEELKKHPSPWSPLHWAHYELHTEVLLRIGNMSLCCLFTAVVLDC